MINSTISQIYNYYINSFDKDIDMTIKDRILELEINNYKKYLK